MSQTLQIVDASGTVLFDLNGTNTADAGSVTVTLYQPLDLGVGTPNYERLNHPNTDGGATIGGRRGLVGFTVPIRLQGSTYDARALGLSRLAGLLDSGCVMKFLAEGSVNTRYIDVEPSPTPALIDGREMALWDATRLLDNPEPFDLQLVRQPYLRGLELDPRTNQLTNATLLRDTPVDGTPDDWAWSSTANITNQQIVATTDDAAAFQFDIAVAATRGLRQTTIAGSAAPGDVKVVSYYARVTSSSYTNMQAEALYQFYQSDGTTVVGSEVSGGLTTLTTSWQRISVTSSAAGALTSRYRANLRIAPTSAASATVQYKFAQAEDDTLSTFRVGLETPSNDPATAPGRVVFFYNAGELAAPVRGYYEVPASAHAAIVAVRGSSAAAWANYAYKQAESMTQGTNTATAAVGATASGAGNDTSLTTFGTNNLTVARLTWVLSAAELAGVIGARHQLWARVAATVLPAIYNLQAGVSFGGGVYRLPYVNHTPASTSYIEVNMGSFTVPTDASAVTVTLYGEIVSGGFGLNLSWDFAHLVPTEQAAVIDSQGTGTLLESDPSIPRVSMVSSVAGAVTYVGTTAGPTPFWATPGLNAVYITRATTAVGNDLANQLFTSDDVSFYYAPRYPL